jgi:hypothetical protein
MMSTPRLVQAALVPSNHTDVLAPTSVDTLQTFTLDDLAQYTREGAFGPTASPDFRVFHVGRATMCMACLCTNTPAYA